MFTDFKNLQTRKIKINLNINRQITEESIINTLHQLYKQSAFSTFPYIFHENMSSKNALTQFHSGDCVALSIQLQMLLKTQGIHSFLIPATIPNKYKFDGYLDISHVALAIPLDKYHFYIVDIAFYFLNPLEIDIRTLNKNNEPVFSKNIYLQEIPNTHLKNYKSIEVVHSKTRSHQKYYFNSYQIIPPSSCKYFIESYYETDPTDTWNYYLTEIINPDEAITSFYINIRRKPFIATTTLDENGICTMGYYITLNNIDKTIKIDKRTGTNEKTDIYKLNELPLGILCQLENELKVYFNGNLTKYVCEYLNHLHDNENKIYLIKD